MAGTPISAVQYSVNRLTVTTHSSPAEFQSRYEGAVPPRPLHTGIWGDPEGPAY